VKRIAQNVVLVAASILVSLVAVEAGLRLFVGGREPARGLREMLGQSRASTPDPGVANVSLRGLVQASAHDLIVYELKPGLRATFIGVPVAINRAGFRERDLPQAKPSNTFRIVGLGDSEMFGWGVPAEATYLRVLEDLLQARGDGIRYETLNFAVPGYNAVMEVETFRVLARSYQPDLVVVGYIPNDDQLPNFLRQPSRRFPDNLYVYNLLVHGVRAMRKRAGDLMPFPTEPSEAQVAARGNLPKQYRDMVGPEAVRRAYDGLGAMTREMSVPVVVMGFYRGRLDPSQVAELEARSRFVFVEASDLRAAYQRKRGVTLTHEHLTLGPRDGHSNVLGHRVYADGLYDLIIARGLTAR